MPAASERCRSARSAPRREPDDDELRQVELAADAASGLVPVHLRHLHFHQDRIVRRRCAPQLGQRGRAIHASGHLRADMLEDALGDAAIDVAVVGDP
jgi:hypothetical protein